MQLPLFRNIFSSFTSHLALPARAIQRLGRQSAQVAFHVHQAAIRAQRVSADVKVQVPVAPFSALDALGFGRVNVNPPAFPELSRTWELHGRVPLALVADSLQGLSGVADDVVQSPTIPPMAGSFPQPVPVSEETVLDSPKALSILTGVTEPGCAVTADSIEPTLLLPPTSATRSIFAYVPSTLKGSKKPYPRASPAPTLPSRDAVATAGRCQSLVRPSAYVVDREIIEDVPVWLASLRLRQYIPLFCGFKWDKMVELSGEELEGLGVRAVKSREKLLSVFRAVRGQVAIPRRSLVDHSFWAQESFSWADDVEKEFHSVSLPDLSLPDTLPLIENSLVASSDKSFWAPATPFSWADEVESELYGACGHTTPTPSPPSDDAFWAPAVNFSWADNVEEVFYGARGQAEQEPVKLVVDDSFWAPSRFSWADEVEDTLYGADKHKGRIEGPVDAVVEDLFWVPAKFSWADDVDAEFAARELEHMGMDSTCVAEAAKQIDGALQLPCDAAVEDSFWTPAEFSWADEVDAEFAARGLECVGVDAACVAEAAEQIDGAPRPSCDVPAVPSAPSAPTSIFGYRPSTLKGSGPPVSRQTPSPSFPPPASPPPPLRPHASLRPKYTVDRALLDDIPGWLSSLRLRQYIALFEGMGWEKIVRLDERGLEALGVRAAKSKEKLGWVFEGVREQEGVVVGEVLDVGSGIGLRVGVESGVRDADEEEYDDARGSEESKMEGEGEEGLGLECRTFLGSLPGPTLMEALDLRMPLSLPPPPPISTAAPRAAAMGGAIPLIRRRLHVAARATAFRHAMPGLRRRTQSAAAATVAVGAPTVTVAAAVPAPTSSASPLTSVPLPALASTSMSGLASGSGTAFHRVTATRGRVSLDHRMVHVADADIPASLTPAPPVPIPLASAHPAMDPGVRMRFTIEPRGQARQNRHLGTGEGGGARAHSASG